MKTTRIEEDKRDDSAKERRRDKRLELVEKKGKEFTNTRTKLINGIPITRNAHKATVINKNNVLQ